MIVENTVNLASSCLRYLFYLSVWRLHFLVERPLEACDHCGEKFDWFSEKKKKKVNVSDVIAWKQWFMKIQSRHNRPKQKPNLLVQGFAIISNYTLKTIQWAVVSMCRGKQFPFFYGEFTDWLYFIIYFASSPGFVICEAAVTSEFLWW